MQGGINPTIRKLIIEAADNKQLEIILTEVPWFKHEASISAITDTLPTVEQLSDNEVTEGRLVQKDNQVFRVRLDDVTQSQRNPKANCTLEPVGQVEWEL